ncbi:MAG: hypothetical protein JWL61_3500 [Gemmatimonadetes bacterium]|nr:hypothetical protein [Gemmatimonadota bacterium]
MNQSQLPVPPAPPSPDVAVFVGGQPVDALQAQLRELTEARQGLETARSALQAQLGQLRAKSTEHFQREAQIAQFDQRIATLDQVIANVQSSPPPDPWQLLGTPPPYVSERALPKDIFVLSGIFIVCVCLPLALAVALRIMKRGVAKVAAFPSDLADRLGRIETAIESTAIEVERIGEGQRYLTRVLGDRRAEELLERPKPVAPYRIITPH